MVIYVFLPKLSDYKHENVLISHNLNVPPSSPDINTGLLPIIDIDVNIDVCPLNLPIIVTSWNFGLISYTLIYVE